MWKVAPKRVLFERSNASNWFREVLGVEWGGYFSGSSGLEGIKGRKGDLQQSLRITKEGVLSAPRVGSKSENLSRGGEDVLWQN